MDDLCEKIQKQLTKMHLGKQPIDGDPEVKVHLDTCVQCRLHLDRLRHNFQELEVDADTLDQYVGQVKSKQAQTTQQVQTRQPRPPAGAAGSKRMIWTSSAILLVMGLYLAWPLLRGRRSDSVPAAPNKQGQARSQRARPMDDQPKETGEAKLAREHQLAERFYAERNVEGLLSLLDTGLNQTKQTAAIYLANIGDKTTLQALQTRSQAWDPQDGINPYTKAITRMQLKVARSTPAHVGSASLAPEPAPVPALTGLVQDPNGAPIAGARVYAYVKGRPISLTAAPARDQASITTDASGTFSLVSQPDILYVVVAHDQGVAVTTPEELSSGHVIALEPWASLRGNLYLDSKRLAGYTLNALSAEANETLGYLCQSTTQTDELGQFFFSRLVPGKVSLLHDTYELRPGQTWRLRLRANARTVKGRMQLAGHTTATWNAGFVADVIPLLPDARWPELDQPENFEQMTLGEVEQWCSEFVPTPPTVPVRYSVQANETGEFQLGRLPAGQYALHGQLFDTSSDPLSSAVRGRIWHVFEIPRINDLSQLKGILDLGTITLIPGPLHPGDIAPAFDLPTPDLDRIVLREYRDELVLLSFYSLDNLAPGDPHIDELASIQRLYGTQAQFTLIGMLSSPLHPLITKKTLNEADLNWPHALLSSHPSLPAESAVEEIQFHSQERLEYDVPGTQPWNILIGPDGHILEIGLHGQELIGAIEAGLAENARL